MKVSREVVFALLIAQGLSFLLSITSVTSADLQSHGVSLPATQLLLNYILMALFSTPIWVWQRHRKTAAGGGNWSWPPLAAPWQHYALLAFLDVAANTLVTSAYQYTSMTSVALLDCFTIPAIMGLSTLVLKSKYNVGHIAGGIICVSGLAVLVVADVGSHTDSTAGGSASAGSNPILGDALVVVGATLYALCNVGEEYLLNDVSVMEFLSMVGIFGTVINGVQVAVVEGRQLAAMNWSPEIAVPTVLFSLALWGFYQGVPLVLRWGGAALLNLSLLTADLWTAAARELFFGGFGGSMVPFAIALVMEAVGIFLYSYSGSVKHTDESGPDTSKPFFKWQRSIASYMRLSTQDTVTSELDQGMEQEGNEGETEAGTNVGRVQVPASVQDEREEQTRPQTLSLSSAVV